MNLWNLLIWLLGWFFPVAPATNLKLTFTKGTKTMQQQANITWTPTPGITQQVLTISVNGTPVASGPVTLAPTAAAYNALLVNDNDKVDVSLVEMNGALASTPATASATAPVTTPPAPATGLAINFTPVHP